MAKKIIFCILDTSGLISKNSKNLKPRFLFKRITRLFVDLMKKYLNTKMKTDLVRNIEKLAFNGEIFKYFDFYLD